MLVYIDHTVAIKKEEKKLKQQKYSSWRVEWKPKFISATFLHTKVENKTTSANTLKTCSQHKTCFAGTQSKQQVSQNIDFIFYLKRNLLEIDEQNMKILQTMAIMPDIFLHDVYADVNKKDSEV